jgi:hypothetical protein
MKRHGKKFGEWERRPPETASDIQLQNERCEIFKEKMMFSKAERQYY